MSIFTVAIVGRANVGKTTLFNRIVGKRQEAIVANVAGVTRDRNEVVSDFFDIKAKFVDAAGIEFTGMRTKNVIEKQMFQQAVKSIENADICVFVIDGKVGVIDTDMQVLNLLRKHEKKVITVINKAENANNIDIDNLYQLGDKPILISASHNLGIGDLYEALLREYELYKQAHEEEQEQVEDTSHKIRIAILGRPNAGKSTFLNKLLGEERVIASDIAGTTRDKVEIPFKYNNHEFVLIDTAGIRKRHKEGDNLELASVDKSFEALQFADIAVMIMDISVALEEQDLTLCQKICNEGRILVICFNKWDLVESTKDNNKLMEMLKERIRKSIAQVKGIVFFTCSALHDDNLSDMLAELAALYDRWNTKIGAGRFNRAISDAYKRPGIVQELKIKYINQIKVRPPTFVAFSGLNEKKITVSKIEALKNWLYREFNLLGVPTRLSVRGKVKDK
ncbi:MAG: ribosome biogenesis GTPase Der [Rickettsiales bacterium]|nr:ribosome biogenesis GTPase Der [Rickettsiales bacterium]